MKMSTEHYNTLRERIIPFVPKLIIHKQNLLNTPKYKSGKGDIDLRIRWDAHHAARMYDVYSYDQYDYKDSHIDTALRKIQSEFNF